MYCHSSYLSFLIFVHHPPSLHLYVSFSCHSTHSSLLIGTHQYPSSSTVRYGFPRHSSLSFTASAPPFPMIFIPSFLFSFSSILNHLPFPFPHLPPPHSFSFLSLPFGSSQCLSSSLSASPVPSCECSSFILGPSPVGHISPSTPVILVLMRS